MKFRVKKFVGSMLVSSMVLSSFAGSYVYGDITDSYAQGYENVELLSSVVNITDAGGELECIYATWNAVEGAESYNAYYKLSSETTYTKIDSELIRGTRVDVPGLKGESDYQIKVVPVVDGSEVESSAAVTSNLTTISYDRSGFAFSPLSPNGKTTGGYNEDGTIAEDAHVIYVSDYTKDIVTLDVITDSKGNTTKATGIGEIFKYREKGNDTRPLIIRLVGTVNRPAGIDSATLLNIKGTKNVTIEGIGEDTYVYGWGINVRGSQNIEIRNLGICWFGDDGVSCQVDNYNIWIHNNDFFYGAKGSAADQVKGDGSCDIKDNSTWVTVSYNHFFDSGKSSLCGMKNEDRNTFKVTYHHNWFDHSDSRHPRVRSGTVHVYNNYFDGNSKYGIGSTTGSSIFVENNYFNKCKYPMLTSQQGSDVATDSKGTFSGEDGGSIKAYGNTIIGATRFVDGEDAYITKTKDEKVPDTYISKKGAYTYNNFDTDSTMYNYKLDTAEEGKENVIRYAGRLNGGALKFTFTEADDIDYGVNQQLYNALPNPSDVKNSAGVGTTPDGNIPGGEETTKPGDVTEETTESTTNAPVDTNAVAEWDFGSSAFSKYSDRNAMNPSAKIDDLLTIYYPATGVTASSATATDGTKLTANIKLNKLTSISSDNKNTFTITAKKGQTIRAYANISSNGGSIVFADSSKNVVKTVSPSDKNVNVIEYTAEKDDTFYVYCANQNVYFYKLALMRAGDEATESTTENASESTTENTSESTTENTSESTTEDTSESTTEDTSESTTENTSESTTEDSNKDTMVSYDFESEMIIGTEVGDKPYYTVTGEIEKEGANSVTVLNGQAFVKDEDAKATTNFIVPFQKQDNNIITIQADVTPSVKANKWTLVQIHGTKANDVLGEICSVRTDASGFYGLRLGSGEPVESTDVSIEAGTTAKIKFTIDLENKKVKLSVNGKETSQHTLDVSDIQTLRFVTATGTRNLYVDNVLISKETDKEPDVPTFMYGDVNQDNAITSTDAAIVMQYVFNNELYTLTGNALEAAKVTGSDVITATNSAHIQQKVLNDEFKFPVER